MVADVVGDDAQEGRADEGRAVVDGGQDGDTCGRHDRVGGQCGDTQREAERCPDAPQGDARNRQRVVGGERHEQQADNRSGEGDAQQRGCPQARFEARGREAHNRHHEEEKREGRGRRSRREAIAVDHGQVEPVVRRALHEAGAHDHEGDEDGLLFAPRDAGESLRCLRRGLLPLAVVRILHGGDGGDFLLGQVEADGGAAGDQFKGGKAEEVDA